MTTAHDIEWPQLLAERLTTTYPTCCANCWPTFIHTLMGAEAHALCGGAGYGQRSTNSRSGYRHRQFDTRAGTLELAIPKLGQGSCSGLAAGTPQTRRTGLTTVVATCI